MDTFWIIATVSSILFAVVTLVVFIIRNNAVKAILFFGTLSVFALIFEGLSIRIGLFEYVECRYSLLGVPIAVILYWFGMYYLYLVYEKWGSNIQRMLLIAVLHLIIDALILTPLAVLVGYWEFQTTLFDSYPYISIPTHIGEVLFVLLFAIVCKRYFRIK